jgi:hypothetical protein
MNFAMMFRRQQPMTAPRLGRPGLPLNWLGRWIPNLALVWRPSLAPVWISSLALVWMLGWATCGTVAASQPGEDAGTDAGPGYARQVAPVLRKYCGGCHNAADKEGDFSVGSFDALLAGTPTGAVIVPGDPDGSRLLQLVTGSAEPKMPPEDEAQPAAAEIELLRRWIAAGAADDSASIPLAERVAAPMLPPDPRGAQYTTALVAAGPGQLIAARFGAIEWLDAAAHQSLAVLGGLSGKVNQLRLSHDGRYLLVASGIAGVGGEVTLVDTQERTIAARLNGHSDAIYSAVLSPDGRWLATGSYDRTIWIWDWRESRVVRKLSGHNGAIYDLDIDPENKVLASASADQTVKLWRLSDGARLDTFGQPEGEMLCVRFTPDGQSVLASGSDHQLRQWRIKSKDRPDINPLLHARFAHEAPVTQLVFAGRDRLLSVSEDKTVKAWAVEQLRPLGVVLETEDVPTGAAVLPGAAGTLRAVVADFAGAFATAEIPAVQGTGVGPAAASESPDLANGMPAGDPLARLRPATAAGASVGALPVIEEQEPNSGREQTQAISLPVRIRGTISASGETVDEDWFAFDAVAGEAWVFEVHAARNGSKLDSRLDILDEQGEPVLRTRLQAMRASYFTFRGKDSSTSDDFRVHKWEDMELNEYLYSGGEVVKLWLYPRGPDSGFKVYPGYGSRYTYFDTTATAHALGAPAYIVRELAADETPLPNGLPIFPVYYQNDDDSQRRWGKDSKLTFTAPHDGRYWLRLRDARGLGGDDHTYELHVRRPQPDFELSLAGREMQLPRGSGREWQVTAKRLDGLIEPITIELQGLPEGFVATQPLIIEAGQDNAWGCIFATADARLPGDSPATVTLVARVFTPQGVIERQLDVSLSLTLTEEPEVQLKLVDREDATRELDELVIHPGETISARVLVARNGHTGPVGLGKEDAGRNLPHGSFVDNIGLNGLLVTEANSDREFFITAAPWLEPQQRWFHLRSDTKGNPTSKPILLRVLPSAGGTQLTSAP